jgi:ubiquinone/menaquinone biosynthesis C-methylase UbiE
MANSDYQHPEYVLGHADNELDRLVRQAAFYGDLTAHTLKLAGLAPGMHVLDLGCGAGDVSFLAASIVGAEGSVTSVDMNADAVALATRRAAESGLENVSFHTGDITAQPYRARFDAVIGRLILLYLGDPVAGLRAFSSYAKPGGIIYFQEFCPPGVSAVPPVPLYEQAIGLINETFARAKIDLYIGMRLAAHFSAAGLPYPQLLGMARVEGGEDSAAYVYMAETIRSLVPLIEKLGVGKRDEIDPDTLAERLKQQTLAAGAVLHLPELIAAWTRVT